MTATGSEGAAPSPLGSGRPVAGGVDRDVRGSGVRLRVTTWPGDGPAVVLLHGLASQRRFWNLVAPDLVAAGLPVVAVDQRGHGDSERPAGPYDVATCASDILRAMDGLDLSEVVVVGHSWGAYVALAVAAADPGRVRSAVAVDGGITAPAELGPRDEIRQQLEPPRLALPPAELASLIARGALAGVWTPAHEDAVLPAFAVGSDGLARARLAFDLHMQVLDGLLDLDVEPLLAGVRCPCWVVSCEPVEGGAADPAYHDGAWSRSRAAGVERAGRLLAQPRLLRWAGAVHDVPLQWPALVAGLVRAAYDEACARQSGGSA